ncbi:MAG: hypothetical protein LUG46_05185 [Erysipelotrichaceae bacterium]|nr:hypothetical protein [Erysipelotrichaceae bacterium]
MKVMFLDIDGVLQPYNSKYKRNVKISGDLLIDYMYQKYKRDYHKHFDVEVLYCLLDWDTKAIRCIRRICEETGTKIVMSTGWRPSTYGKDDPTHLKDLLHVWDLDKYYLGETDAMLSSWSGTRLRKDMSETEEYLKSKGFEDCRRRAIEIADYLMNHNDITNYVIIDDMDLSNCGMDNHFVRTFDAIKDEQAEDCIRILNSNINIHDISGRLIL